MCLPIILFGIPALIVWWSMGIAFWANNKAYKTQDKYVRLSKKIKEVYKNYG